MTPSFATSQFVLIGPPGAGKGTQAAWMSACFGIPTISSSHALRRAVAIRSAIGRDVEAAMASGGLVADEVMNELIFERLAEPDTAGGFVLDGFPRTAAQAVALDEYLGGRLVTAIVLNLPEIEIARRLIARRVCSRCRVPQSRSSHDSRQRECAYCGATLERRADDEEATIKRRLFVYRSTAHALVAHYERRARLVEVNASADPRDVSADIARRIALRDAAVVAGGRSISAS